MRKAVLSLTVLTASKRMMLTLLAASLVGMTLLLGVGIRSAETQTTASQYEAQYLGCLHCGDLGYPVYVWSLSNGINDLGHVVGAAGYNTDMASTYATAFLYKDGEMKDLGIPGDAYDDGGAAINDADQVVGSFSTGNWMPNLGSHGEYQHHAFLYDSTNGMKDLGTLGGTNSRAYGINTSGQIVGYSDTANGGSHAFLYDSTSGMKDLGTLGGTNSYAYGINDSGQVVGDSYKADDLYTPPAFIYQNGRMIDLNALLITEDRGWFLQGARSINKNGQIALSGHNDGFSGGALLLTPTNTPPVSPPDTTITSGPTGTVTSRSATFEFSSNESGSTFECSLDGGAWTKCTSPTTYSNLAVGNHTFKARATGVGGADDTPASQSWTIDATAPTVSNVSPTSGAKSVALNTTVTARFSEVIDPKTLISIPTDPANPNVGTSTTFTLVKSGTTTPIKAKVSYDDSTKTVTLTPSSTLEARTKYTAKISGEVKDLAGNALAPYTWSFTTGSR
jgi:probable HAF family extracellular repeat protein